MDELNMAVMVNLSRFKDKYLEWSLDKVNKSHPNRFIIFLNINFEEPDDEGWPDNTLKMIEEAKALGINGLKVYKSLGLTEKDNEGNHITVDDPQLNNTHLGWYGNDPETLGRL